jgi:hypothetical protein
MVNGTKVVSRQPGETEVSAYSYSLVHIELVSARSGLQKWSEYGWVHRPLSECRFLDCKGCPAD